MCLGSRKSSREVIHARWKYSTIVGDSTREAFTIYVSVLPQYLFLLNLDISFLCLVFGLPIPICWPFCSSVWAFASSDMTEYGSNLAFLLFYFDVTTELLLLSDISMSWQASSYDTATLCWIVGRDIVGRVGFLVISLRGVLDLVVFSCHRHLASE